jgi:hypothetical protein
MRIFIFEDDVERLSWFHDQLRGHDIDWSDHIEVAQEILASEKEWDVVFFDHDMIFEFTDSESTVNNGYKLAIWCVENEIPISQCIVHSHNPDGAEKIANTLRLIYDDVTVAPYRTLRQNGMTITN